MRILFISRRYPPSRGGLQTHALKLFTYLDQRLPVTRVTLGRDSVLHLAWFLPWAWLRAALALLGRRVDVVHFDDGVATALAWALAPLRGRARLCCTLHGLEMTFPNRWARALMRAGTARCDGIAAVSGNSRRIAAATWGVPVERMRVIHQAVEPPEPPPERDEELRRAFEAGHGVVFGRDRLLLNLGRMVPRKGLARFVERGMPLLPADARLLVVGDGPDAAAVRAARDGLDDPGRVLLLGVLDDDTCSMLRRRCDLFLMPNVATEGDVEGFGIAPLEAMYLGTPVVAFAVDALVEAVREGGWLVPAGDYEAFAAAVRAFYDLTPEERRAAGDEARRYCRREYDWETASSRYLELFRELRS